MIALAHRRRWTELALCCAIAVCSEGTSEYTPSIGLPIGLDFLPVSHGSDQRCGFRTV
jgi:hypothetical protein